MYSPPKSLCSKCFKSLQNDIFLDCVVCCSKYHFHCTQIDEKSVSAVLNSNKNIVFNCDQCMLTSNNLACAVRSISNEVRELKIMMTALTSEMNTLKNASDVTAMKGQSSRVLFANDVDDNGRSISFVSQRRHKQNKVNVAVSNTDNSAAIVGAASSSATAATDGVVADGAVVVVNENDADNGSVVGSYSSSLRSGNMNSHELHSVHASLNSENVNAIHNQANISGWVNVTHKRKQE